MSIHVALNHVMHYRYDRLVTLGPQIIRLRPAPHCRTRILSYSLNVRPEEHFINWRQDPQANYLARLVFAKPARELKNVVFAVKMGLVLTAAGLTFLAQRPIQAAAEKGAAPPGFTRPFALASLVLWAAIVFAGRWIAYV